MVVAFILSTIAGGLAVIVLIWSLRGLRVLANYLASLIPTKYIATENPEDDHIQIVVVGDIGRSPRMQYHAISFAKLNRMVDIVGFRETARHPELIGNPNVNVFPLTPVPEWIAWNNLPFFINIPCKVLQQFYTLYCTLMYTAPAAKWMVLQNPPSIPLFHIALFVSWMRGSKIVVDWHNYGHTILAQNKLYSLFVPIYRWYEMRIGRFLGNANLAVTDAMTAQLQGAKYKLKGPIRTLHDRPAAIFEPVQSDSDRMAILQRIPETKKMAKDILSGSVRLIVSSTSWTADEDFGMLLDALMAYAIPEVVAEKKDFPVPILAIITGKGPQKEAYLAKIKELTEAGKLPGIQVTTAWLSNRDYAGLLAASDLGISLHKSSSGVDLPMKVVDMFGAGLPVAAYSDFESFGELVKEGQNGCGFVNANELTAIFRRLLSDEGAKELSTLKQGAVKEGSLRWDEQWTSVVPKLMDLE
ncbi:hypothetical protein VHEMI03416 [[Torrubiella] hemipterigena]|uniref:Chitobiosyldiphosphodolichol beta-mannosyltransferase n=1 Tax=[Torrubiella] hemipterigena TaxID=1531966 RepID=A0A0A1TAR2_9HYPO|nr:hypothetical protein VHEMI03416 [[Torrubiella] hemipterigena]